MVERHNISQRLAFAVVDKSNCHPISGKKRLFGQNKSHMDEGSSSFLYGLFASVRQIKIKNL